MSRRRAYHKHGRWGDRLWWRCVYADQVAGEIAFERVRLSTPLFDGYQEARQLVLSRHAHIKPLLLIWVDDTTC